MRVGFKISRLLALLLCLILWPAAQTLADLLKVEVLGVEGDARKNILALLAINQEAANKDVDPERIEALHRRADEQILRALMPFGYFKARVTGELIPPSTADQPWQARFAVDPGPQISIGVLNYQIMGPGASDPAFPKTLGIATGQVFSQSAYQADKERITRIASQQGYLDARWEVHQVLIEDSPYQARIELLLQTGPRYYFGQVDFDQDLLSDDFLRRYLPFQPGDHYDPDQLLELQGSLLGAEYFSDVEIRPELDEADPNEVVPLTLIAQRKKANQYRVGLGLSTDYGPRFSLEYKRRYLGRQGHKLSADLSVTPRLQSLSMDYRIPIRDPRRDYLLIRPQFEQFDTESRKGQLSKLSLIQSISVADGWRRDIGLDYRYEDSEVSNGESQIFNGLVPSIAWSRTRADDPINTRQGERLKLTLQGTRKNLLSDQSWLSARLGGKWIRTLGGGLRLIGRTDLGVVLAERLDDVPASQRFFAGGDNSLRGWDLNALGPKDAEGRVVGGRYLAVGSLEVEKRIKGNWGGALFTDFGNAFDPDVRSDWEQSLGIGVRYATPIGPVRVDLAYPLTQDSASVRLHFGLGPDL